MTEAYVLRAVMQCHDADIRCVCALPGGGFVTGSRDKTCKAYQTNGKSNDFTEVQNLLGAQNYISSVCCLHSATETLIYVGSNDSNIYCYSLEHSEPLHRLMDHSGTVCALTASNDKSLIASGSWDLSCRVWSDNKCKAVLVGHEGSVWATGFIGEYVITGSADKTLKLWKFETKIECVETMRGHNDCIRGIAVISDTNFLSCSNDASIREWNLKGETIREFVGHENYIYSVANIISGHEFATCGEDRTVRIWNNTESIYSVQTIRLPETTLWSLTRLSNSDLVIGSSTGKLYIYTRDESLAAKPEKLKELEEELAKATVPLAEIGDMKVNDLPTPEALLAPGKRDGQTKMVKDGNKVTVHNWDAKKFEWVKIGEVVGTPGPANDASKRQLHDGVEYDYVFSIDVEEGKPQLKLPYNLTQDPWTVAQDFIHKHNLSQTYLDEIVNFITKNSDRNSGQFSGGQNLDPFTGGSSYSTQPNGLSQPMDTSEPTVVANAYYPQKTHLLFESHSIEGIAKKLKEFSQDLPPELKLENKDIELLLKLSDFTLEVQPQQLRLIRIMLAWPKNKIFPALDLIRLSLLLPQINEDLCASKDSLRLIDTLLVCGTDANSTPNQLVAYRALANMFAHTVGEHLA
ncbi:unnamed protein product, partial [Medioppia subpectinata]